MKLSRLIPFGLLLSVVGLTACSEIDTGPVDPFRDTVTVPFGTVVTGSINAEDDVDYYKVVTSETGVAEIIVSSIPESLGLKITTFDAQKQPIDTSNGVTNGKAFRAEYLAEATTYYIKVERSYGTPSSDMYEIRANFDNSDKNELNNSFETATPVELGTVATGAVYGKGDADYYKFTTTETGVFELTISGIPEQVQLLITLFDAEKVKVEGTVPCCYNTGKSYRAENLSEATTYYLKVEGTNSLTSPGLYEVRSSLDTSDVNELNNSFETATPLSQGVTTQGAIYGSGDTDFYIFTAPSSGDYNIVFSGIPEGFTMRAFVFDSEKVQLNNAGCCFSTGKPLIFPFTAEAGEKFYLKIDGGGNSSPEKYDVAANKL